MKVESPVKSMVSVFHFIVGLYREFLPCILITIKIPPGRHSVGAEEARVIGQRWRAAASPRWTAQLTALHRQKWTQGKTNDSRPSSGLQRNPLVFLISHRVNNHVHLLLVCILNYSLHYCICSKCATMTRIEVGI